ncbi:Ribosome maturation protein SBDS [Ilyonectria robusta]
MTRGEGSQSKVHHKGKLDDYIVFVDDVETYKKWQNDKSIPLPHFISPFTVFLTHKDPSFAPVRYAPIAFVPTITSLPASPTATRWS